MTKLTKNIQNCGIHDCNHECYAISEADAKKAIKVMREAFIEAVNAEYDPDIDMPEHFARAIKAIQSVK